MSLMTFAKIAVRNLFSKPVTTTYPLEPANYPEGSRGHIELNIEECVLCGSCATHCPTGTIVVDRKAGTWTMNRFDCVQCGSCVQSCPKHCLTIVPGYFAPGTEKVSETFQKPMPEVPLKPRADLEKCKFCTLCAKKCPQGAIAVDRAAKSWTLEGSKCVSCGLCKDNCHFNAIEMAPEEVSHVPVADLSKCKFCTLCAKKCPQGAITVDRAAKSWTLDDSKCVGCGLCRDNCHFGTITIG